MNTELIKKKIIHYLRDKDFMIEFLFFSLILIIFLINGTHERYPDEFDNILGGKYLLEGKLIYKDWFTHHGPFPYFLSAVINIFSNNSFVNFRLIYSILLFLLTLGSYVFLKNRLKNISVKFYLFFIFILGLASTYFWGQMLLADNIAAFLLTPVFALIFLKVINNRKFEITDYVFISLFTSIALLSALTYAFLIAGMYAFLFIYYFIKEKRNFNFVFLIKILLIIITPYLVFLIYLLITGSLSSYIYEALIFNKEYYIYYPGHEGKPPSNPIRYAIVMLQGFHNNFSSMLNTVKGFNFDFPFNITLGIANTVLGIYLIFKRKYLLAAFIFGILVYANARSNPFSSGETDYQSAVYIMISLFNLCYILPALYKELNLNIEYSKKLILSLLFVLLLIYSFFSFTFLLRKFSYKTYDKYMGFAASIYDGPGVVRIVNQIVPEGNYAWIGPFAFEDLYYLNADVPSRYQILLPGMAKSEKIPGEIISDFTEKRPDVIYFNKDFFILGNNPSEYGAFFMKFLDENYIKLEDYDGGRFKYSEAIDPSFLLNQKLYINKNIKEDVIDRMKKQDLIKPN